MGYIPPQKPSAHICSSKSAYPAMNMEEGSGHSSTLHYGKSQTLEITPEEKAVTEMFGIDSGK